MRMKLTRRISRRHRRVFRSDGPEQLETRTLLAAAGVISGTVFYDTDADGVQDEGETGVTGVLVTLTGTTEGGDSVIRRQLTRGDGSFSFEGLQDGTYELIETQPTGLADGADQTTAEGPIPSNDRYSNIVVANDAVFDGLNFGEGLIDAEFVSPIWLLASSGTEQFQRNMRASLEEGAGNPDLADAIRAGDEEVDSDFNLNAAPVSAGDSYSVDASQALIADAAQGVLANDTDAEGSALSSRLISGPENGTVDLNSDGSFTYTPTTAFIGSDSFTYVANDGFKDSEIATVSIDVLNPNIFSVSDSEAVEGDVLGSLTSLTGVTEPAVFQFASESPQPELGLVPDDRMIGLEESPALLIEYVDFACPACRAAHDTIRGFETSLAGGLLVVQRYFSRLTSRNAIEASLAAEAAAQQDLYLPMTDLLFDNQDEWTASDDPNALFEQYISDAGLEIDLGRYRADIADPATRARIDRDAASAAAVGALGTPTYFLNGELISPTPAPESLPGLVSDAVSEARLNPFTIHRTTGELRVLSANRLDVDATPLEEFDVDIRNNTQSETIAVDVNVLA